MAISGGSLNDVQRRSMERVSSLFWSLELVVGELDSLKDEKLEVMRGYFFLLDSEDALGTDSAYSRFNVILARIIEL